MSSYDASVGPLSSLAMARVALDGAEEANVLYTQKVSTVYEYNVSAGEGLTH